MKKDTATAIFDRLDDAGAKVALKALSDREYEVELGVESLDGPEMLELLARLVTQHQVRLIPGIGSIVIAGVER